MNELFRNFGLISNTNEISASSESSRNPFVGDVIEIKNFHLKLEDLIAEGGFGYVFRAKDLKTNHFYAVKRMIASDDESTAEILNEISMLERVQTHNHIIQFFGFETIKSKSIYYLLWYQSTFSLRNQIQIDFHHSSEYCGSGSLKDIQMPLLNKQQFNRIIYQLSLALEKLHILGITHRDIKIENVLFDNDGFLKLCDFGSSTDKSYQPDHSWNPIQRSLLEDEMNRHTTPMYRPPEILDTYLHYEINCLMDIWALGCLIYFLRFGQHPFEDSSKLRIINCNFTFPQNINYSDLIINLIKNCLVVNPKDRINATNIIKLMEENFVDLNSPCVNSRNIQTSTNLTPNQNQPSNHIPGIAQSYLQGFTKYLKDTSNRVMQTMQSSIARQDLDLKFLTSRLIVMSYPAEGLESAYRNHIDDVKAVLESRNCNYSVVNVSGRSYDSSKFGRKIKIFDGGTFWKDTKKVCPIKIIVLICDHIFKWMKQNQHNLIVIHCMDGLNNSAMLTISFFLLIGLFHLHEKALEFFERKRGNLDLSKSQHRYLKYVEELKRDKYLSFFSIKKTVILKSIQMYGLPLFTKLRDGCRPFIELYIDSKKIFTSLVEYDRLSLYTRGNSDSVLWRDLNKKFDITSDITLIVSHARSTIGSKMLTQNKPTIIRMASISSQLEVIQ
ncbi:cyclin-G-associated kinase-like protein [Sarcoptes scabiei]|uniref:Cyclin-G-associated kinase-like protein n=1 Tax=Sarcoptes scabiei TaxID=52283 RepID=A0A131ZSI2_SARSC|nr:cyclin-G-associated kinase-like protein [Sarcoptes scabiei]